MDFTPIVSLTNFREVSTTEIAVKCDGNITTFLEFLRDSLRMNRSQIQTLRVSQRKSFRHLYQLWFISSFHYTTIGLFTLWFVSFFVLNSFSIINFFSFISQIYFSIILWLDTRLVPLILIFWLMLKILVEDRAFKMR